MFSLRLPAALTLVLGTMLALTTTPAAQADDYSLQKKKWTLGVNIGEFHKGFGIEVTKVFPGSAAENYGIRVGDYIHSIGSSVPTASRDFATLLRTETSSSGTVKITWFRKASGNKDTGIREITKNVQLEEAD